MRRNLLALLVLLGITLAVSPVFGKTYAATLQFNPKASTGTVGNTFDVNVDIDSGADQISGAEVHILYDPTLIEPTAVTEGTYFPFVTNNIVSGEIAISATVESGSQYKTGSGTVATVTFKGLKTGTGTLKFDCDLARTDASKILKSDINATNVIECSALSTGSVTISALAGGAGDGTGTDGTGTNGGSGSGTGTTPNQLPQSGVYDSLVKYSVGGVALLAFGVILRLFLRM